MFAETVAGTAPPPNNAPNEIDELCDLLTADPDDQSGPDDTVTVAVSETLMQVGGREQPNGKPFQALWMQVNLETDPD